MKKRMSRCAALIGTVLSLSSFAQVCNEITLYRDGENGRVENGSSFPEAPEWKTNWGNMGSLVAPYIRWSGVSNQSDDWTGSLAMNGLPAYVQGGELKLDVRGTQKMKVGVWLEGDFGKSPVYYHEAAGNESVSLSIPVSNLVGSGRVLVQRIGFGLFNVPANQYQSVFMDNVALTCGVSENALEHDSDSTTSYIYSDVNPRESRRETRFMRSVAAVTSAAYDEKSRSAISDSTKYEFVLNEMEHGQIEDFVQATSISPKKSREGWFKSMYLIERNRLRDSVIANPKSLFYEANSFAANSENSAMPILVGNVDYGYRICNDTLCNSTSIVGGRALLAGLPSWTVEGSKFKIFYDPYFISTNRSSIPNLEIYGNGKWNAVPIKSEFIVELESAGVQQVKVRLSEGGQTVTQTLFVEVK